LGMEKQKPRVVVARRRGLEVIHGDYMKDAIPAADVYYCWDCERTHEGYVERLLKEVDGSFTILVGADTHRKMEVKVLDRILGKYRGTVKRIPYNEGDQPRQSGTFLVGVIEVNRS
jgi:hypothetical protein